MKKIDALEQMILEWDKQELGEIYMIRLFKFLVDYDRHAFNTLTKRPAIKIIVRKLVKHIENCFGGSLKWLS